MLIKDLDIQAFIERLSESVLLISTDGQVLDANAAALKSYGYTLEEITSMSVLDLRAPETHDAVEGDLANAGKHEFTFETVHLRSSGEPFPVEVNSTLVSFGMEQALLSIVRDITARKIADDAVAEREVRYRTLAEFTQDWIFWVRPDGTFRYVSPSAERIIGLTAAEIATDPRLLDAVVHPDDAERYAAHTHHLDDSPVFRDQYRMIRPDGEVRWIEHVCASARDDDGVWLGRVGSNRDVTKRVAAQEAVLELHRQQASSELRATERTLELFVEFAPAAIAMFDLDMHYLAASRRFYVDYGLPDADIVGRCHYDVFPEIDERWKNVHRRALAGETLRCEEDPFPRADGTLDWVRWEIRPWYETEGGIGGIILFSEVITSQKNSAIVLQAANERLEESLHATVGMMGKVVEARDPYTQGHEEAVARISRLIAEELGWTQEEIEEVETAALVHDIGKLSVPAEILTRPGVLSDVELRLVRTHAKKGYELLRQIPFGKPIADIVHQHHERMDGSGYPQGLSGEEILRAARVIAVADTIEAMASHRPYRPALGLEAAMAEVVGGGSRFDAEVVGSAVRLEATGQLAQALEAPPEIVVS